MKVLVPNVRWSEVLPTGGRVYYIAGDMLAKDALRRKNRVENKDDIIVVSDPDQNTGRRYRKEILKFARCYPKRIIVVDRSLCVYGAEDIAYDDADDADADDDDDADADDENIVFSLVTEEGYTACIISLSRLGPEHRARGVHSLSEVVPKSFLSRCDKIWRQCAESPGALSKFLGPDVTLNYFGGNILILNYQRVPASGFTALRAFGNVVVHEDRKEVRIKLTCPKKDAIRLRQAIIEDNLDWIVSNVSEIVVEDVSSSVQKKNHLLVSFDPTVTPVELSIRFGVSPDNVCVGVQNAIKFLVAQSKRVYIPLTEENKYLVDYFEPQRGEDVLLITNVPPGSTLKSVIDDNLCFVRERTFVYTLGHYVLPSSDDDGGDDEVKDLLNISGVFRSSDPRIERAELAIGRSRQFTELFGRRVPFISV